MSFLVVSFLVRTRRLGSLRTFPLRLDDQENVYRHSEITVRLPPADGFLTAKIEVASNPLLPPFFLPSRFPGSLYLLF